MSLPNPPLVHPRFAPALVLASCLLYGCGPRPPAKETQVRRAVSADQALAGALNVSVSDEVRLDFRLTNGASRAIELNFPSGRTHDFVVMDTTGRELWKWSDGRLFTQVMQNKVLRRDEALSWNADWDPGSHHGTFIAAVSVRSDNHPFEQQVRFTIP